MMDVVYPSKGSERGTLHYADTVLGFLIIFIIMIIICVFERECFVPTCAPLKLPARQR